VSCPSCGAALAEDQRYCLNCGRRQGAPRVDFQRHLDPARAAAKAPSAAAEGSGGSDAAPPPGPPPVEKPQRDYAPLAAAGGIAVLGIMLLIGVLIGRGTGSDQPSAAAPQVVTVAQDGAEESGGKDSKEQGAGAGDGSARKKAGKSKNTAANGSTDTGNAPVASEQQLEALQGKTGQEYAEESAKLPDEIATPGEAPPTDQKAPGGGSGGGVTLE
jgi:hypothetical protein